jgi:hypothetical protein
MRALQRLSACVRFGGKEDEWLRFADGAIAVFGKEVSSIGRFAAKGDQSITR